MDIVSIDNVFHADGSSDDGAAQLVGALGSIAAWPSERKLIAVVPEYTADGRLVRLDVCSVPMEDPGGLTKRQAELMIAAVAVVAEEQARRAAMLAHQTGIVIKQGGA